MINNSTNKKFSFNFFKRVNNPIGDRNLMHPEREWFFGIVGGLTVLIIGLLWSLNTYSHYNYISITNSSATNDLEVYKTELVNSALIDMLERQRIYNEIKSELANEKPVSVDFSSGDDTETEQIVEPEIILETEPETITEITPVVSE